MSTITPVEKLASNESGVEKATITDSAPAKTGGIETFGDATSGQFFRRQLVELEEAEEFLVSPNSTTLAFPTESRGGWKNDFVYAITRFYGQAVIAECCDTVPNVGISRCEVTSSALTIQTAAKWCWMDIERAREAGENLEADYLMGAQQALEDKLEELIWSGYTPLGVTGILNNPTINRINIGGLGSISEDLIKIIAQIRNTIVTKLNGRAQPPNTLAVPPSIYALMQTSVVGYNDRSLMGEIQARFGLMVMEIPYLEYAGMGGTPIMAMYRREPNYVRIRIPFDSQPLPVHYDGSHYCRRWFSRFAGVRINQPETFVIVEGLADCTGKLQASLTNCQGRYNCDDM